MPKAKKTAKKAPATRASARVAAAPAHAQPAPAPAQNYYPHAAYHQPPPPPAPAVPANPAYYPNAVYDAPAPAPHPGLYNAPPPAQAPYHAPAPYAPPMVVMQGPGGQPMYLDARAFEQAYAHFAAALPPPGYAPAPPGQYALPPSRFAPAPGGLPQPAPGPQVAFGQHAPPPSRFAPAPGPGPQAAFGQPSQIGHAQLPPPVHYPRAAAQQVVTAPAVRAAIAKAAAATKNKKAAPPPAPTPALPVASTSTPAPAPAPAKPAAASMSTPQRAPTPSSSQVRLPKLPSVGLPPVTPAPSSTQVRLPMLPSPAQPATQATASSIQQPARDDDGWNVVYADWYFQSATEQLLQPCASCGVFFDDEAMDHGERIPGAQTGPRAQLIAIVRALEIARVNDGPLRIKTASDYAVKAIRDWLPGFARNGWRTQAGAPVQNKELLQYVAALLDFRGVGGQRVELAHVPGEPTRPRDVEGFQNAQYLAQEASTNRPSAATEPDWDALRAAVEARGEALLKSGGGVPLRASNVGAGSQGAPEKKPSTVVWAKPKPEPEAGTDKENAPLAKGGRSMLESAARALERRTEPVDVIEIDDDDDNFELSAAQLAALDEIEAVYSQSSQPRATS